MNSKVAVLFLCLLAGHEVSVLAERVRIEKHFLEKTPDLDWPGCGKKAGMFGHGCSKTPGCTWHELWLDTHRQSCRFSDEHKLQRDQISTFLPVELARFEEKTATFAKSGCLLGGWFAKCYRRTFQIMRLSNYVRKAIQLAKADPSHPAHALASSPETTQAFERAADNLGKGFAKYGEKSPQNAALFADAFQGLRQMPEELEAEETKAAAANHSLSAAEKEILEKTVSAKAMLKMVGVDLSDEQQSELYAEIEADGTVGSEDQLDTMLDGQMEDIDALMNDASTEDLKIARQQEPDDDDEVDMEDSLVQEEEQMDDVALSELAETRSAARKALAQRAGGGPLKKAFGWLVHGPGWLLARIAWLLLFVVGLALGLLRIGAFVLLFIGCTLLRFTGWVFGDVIYQYGWEGNTEAVTTGLQSIGRCPAVMWDFVGYDSNAENAATQIFIDPARFASSATGVYHPIKSQKSLCEGVVCGANAFCRAGSCMCQLGFYPSPGGSCGPVTTQNGCVCKTRWTQSQLLGLSSKTHYGCPASQHKCHVDTSSPTYAQCKSKLSTNTGLWSVVTGPGTPKDACTPLVSGATVPALAVPK